MGHERLLSFLQRVRDSFRRPRRPDRAAARADQNRAVVVRLHVTDGHGLELRHAPRRAFLLRDGRGRRLSQRLGGDGALGPGPKSRPRLGHRLDDRPARRREHAAPRHPDPGAIRLAGVFLRLRCAGRALERGLVRLVSRLPVGEARGESAGAHRHRTFIGLQSSRHAVGGGDAQPRLLADRGGWRLLRLFTRVLSVVAADVSREGTWLHGGGAHALVAAVHRRRLRQRARRRRQRRARAPLRPAAWTPDAGRLRPHVRGSLHGGRDV